MGSEHHSSLDKMTIMVAVVEAANTYAAFVSSTMIDKICTHHLVCTTARRRSYYHPDFAEEETDI